MRENRQRFMNYFLTKCSTKIASLIQTHQISDLNLT